MGGGDSALTCQARCWGDAVGSLSLAARLRRPAPPRPSRPSLTAAPRAPLRCRGRAGKVCARARAWGGDGGDGTAREGGARAVPAFRPVRCIAPSVRAAGAPAGPAAAGAPGTGGTEGRGRAVGSSPRCGRGREGRECRGDGGGGVFPPLGGSLCPVEVCVGGRGAEGGLLRGAGSRRGVLRGTRTHIPHTHHTHTGPEPRVGLRGPWRSACV